MEAWSYFTYSEIIKVVFCEELTRIIFYTLLVTYNAYTALLQVIYQIFSNPKSHSAHLRLVINSFQ